MNIKQIISLTQKDFLLEWRQKHTLFGALLYIASTVFVIYMMANKQEGAAWNVLFWLMQLFVTVNAVAKSFMQENENRTRYYYTLVSPVSIMVSKFIYSTILMLVLSVISFAIFTVILGNPLLDTKKFLVTMLLGAASLSILFTFIAAIAAQARQNIALMAILGFPVAVPLLMILSKMSLATVSSVVQEGWLQMLFLLVALDVMIVVLSLILYPFLWKE